MFALQKCSPLLEINQIMISDLKAASIAMETKTIIEGTLRQYGGIIVTTSYVTFLLPFILVRSGLIHTIHFVHSNLYN